MTRTPEPRPALQKAPDGALHPAAPKAAPAKHLHPAPPAPAAVPPAEPPTRFKPGDLRARKAAKAGRPGKPPKKEELVPLDVKVPKKLRKAIRRKAEEEAWSVDDAVAYVLRAWVES